MLLARKALGGTSTSLAFRAGRDGINIALDRAKFFPRNDAFLRELSSASACSAVFFVDDELLLLLLALCHGDMKEKLDMVWFVRRVLVFACRRRLAGTGTAVGQ
jgi:hypothetical protein